MPATRCSSSAESVSWLQLSVAVTRECADAAGEALQAAGAEAVSYVGAGPEELLEPGPGEQPLWERIRLQALLPPDTDLKHLRSRLEVLDASLEDVAFVAPEDWQARWRAHAVRGCFGGRLWLMPRDEPFEPPAPDPAQAPQPVHQQAPVVLRLDPGLAFGSGSHPTTRLCLSALAGLPLDGLDVLDYGCGSGVLAVAAALLGARRVVAVDHDPQALTATRDNARFNGIDAPQLEVLAPDELVRPDAPARQFHVVVANILANPLVQLAPRLTALTRPGGRLLLSGLLEAQRPQVMAAYPDLTFDAPAREGDWVRIDGVRGARS